MDRGQSEGSGLEKFFKVGQWRCLGTCESGTEFERVGKRSQSVTEEVLGEALGRWRYVVARKTLLGYL